MAVLGINCATENLSLAILKDDGSMAEQFWAGPTIRAEQLIDFIETILKKAGITISELTRLGIAIGPGAFTGLRLSLVTAKTIALKLEIPLIPISTLESIANQFVPESGQGLRVFLTACRGDVSTALFNSELERLEPDHPIKKGSLPVEENVIVLEDPVPDAATIAHLAEKDKRKFNKAEILALVPAYSHESRINHTSKPELQHLKIGLK